MWDSGQISKPFETIKSRPTWRQCLNGIYDISGGQSEFVSNGSDVKLQHRKEFGSVAFVPHTWKKHLFVAVNQKIKLQQIPSSSLLFLPAGKSCWERIFCHQLKVWKPGGGGGCEHSFSIYAVFCFLKSSNVKYNWWEGDTLLAEVKIFLSLCNIFLVNCTCKNLLLVSSSFAWYFFA